MLGAHSLLFDLEDGDSMFIQILVNFNQTMWRHITEMLSGHKINLERRLSDTILYAVGNSDTCIPFDNCYSQFYEHVQ